MGFGIETDIRDYRGELVVSHDPPTRRGLTLKELLDLRLEYDCNLTLALNIKADGLHGKVGSLVSSHELGDYFVFDCSVPATIGYIKEAVPFFTRHSEYEQVPTLYDSAHGVWMDMFNADWIQAKMIQAHLDQGKRVAIVSPELHGRKYMPFWMKIREDKDVTSSKDVSLCTDHPVEAEEFFFE